MKVAFKYFTAVREVVISINYLKSLMRNFSMTCKILLTKYFNNKILINI